MNVYKKTYLNFFVIVFLAFFLISFSFDTSATVRIEPARIILNALEKEHSTGMIEVINSGEEEVELTALLNDWALDERDAVVYYDPGETDYTLDGVIKFNPRQFVVPPGKKQIVRFTISRPENEKIPKERRGVVFFEQETEYMDVATGSRVKTQVGTVIYYIPEGVKYSFKFTGLRVYNTSESLPQGIVLRLQNDGDAHMRYYPSYKIVDSENKIVEEKTFNELLILPGYERQFSFFLENKLAPGDYKVLLEFKFYNTNNKAEYQIPIKIE
ncbi:MAG: hypothetical protein ACQESS_02960 [Bacillota bacterium]